MNHSTQKSSRAFKFGDDVDTDQIIPARYLTTFEASELAKYCMEDADPDFAKNVCKGDVIVGLKNFGCGSSREHAPISIVGAGVSAIIAKSFARIFYRNSINLGLPLLECPLAAEEICDGDRLSIDLPTGKIINHTQDKSYQALALPDFAREIMDAGGLMKFVMQQKTAK